jgi:hypothetical protein
MVKTVRFTDPSFQHKGFHLKHQGSHGDLLQIKKHTVSRITNPSGLLLPSVSRIGGCQHEVPWREEAKAREATESEQVGFWVKD